MLTLNVILGASVVMYFVGRNPNLWWVVWPGTVVHELMHAAVGLVLLAQPGKISVWPQDPVPGQARVIGGATFHNLNWFNTLPTAIAPFLGIPLVLMNFHHLHLKETWQVVLAIWIMSTVVAQALPSPTDWSIAFKKSAGIVFWIIVVGLAAYHYQDLLHVNTKSLLHFDYKSVLHTVQNIKF